MINIHISYFVDVAVGAVNILLNNIDQFLPANNRSVKYIASHDYYFCGENVTT